MLGLAVLVEIQEVFLGFADVGLGFGDYSMLSDLGLRGQIGAADRFVDVYVDV